MFNCASEIMNMRWERRRRFCFWSECDSYTLLSDQVL